MIIRASLNELFLEATILNLRELINNIHALKTGDTYYSDAFMIDPSPYEKCLIGLKVVATDGPVNVAIKDQLMIVSGCKTDLNKFASFLNIEKPGSHVHYDNIDGSPYITADSRPLVIGAI